MGQERQRTKGLRKALVAVTLARFVIGVATLESVPPLCAKAATEEIDKTAAITERKNFHQATPCLVL
jgi:hypothetical protein